MVKTVLTVGPGEHVSAAPPNPGRVQCLLWRIAAAGVQKELQIR